MISCNSSLKEVLNLEFSFLEEKTRNIYLRIMGVFCSICAGNLSSVVSVGLDLCWGISAWH